MATPTRSSRETNLKQDGAGNVRVVVRVRKFLPREVQKNAQCLIEMDPKTQETKLLPPPPDPNANKNARRVTEEKLFTFDNSFWSHDDRDQHYAEQEDVYNCLGESFLDHSFRGYHTCIFAYGQTGSGKSYTMMGKPSQEGLIPRTCADLFERIESSAQPSVSYTVRVSYFEVYNEHVRDLLIPRQDPPYYLKIRESPTEGPYVKDLTELPVKSHAEIMRLMRAGDMQRSTASTKMNDTSSRSHAVFTITLKQLHHDMATDQTTEMTSRIRLVDLAGSERAKATEATGARLREGANINKSLTTLGRVIAALADPSHGRGIRKREVVPYRDSILTWLLKDSLGGNSKTAMVACISPTDYEETLSTLRYADQAKHIQTLAVVNQDHLSAAERNREIEDMQAMIAKLQKDLNVAVEVKKREGERETERLEEYQVQVERMQRLMEETRQVCECKIRTLTMENDALKRHLRLAVESIKKPMQRQISVESGGTLATALESEADYEDEDDGDGGSAGPEEYRMEDAERGQHEGQRAEDMLDGCVEDDTSEDVGLMRQVHERIKARASEDTESDEAETEQDDSFFDQSTPSDHSLLSIRSGSRPTREIEIFDDAQHADSDEEIESWPDSDPLVLHDTAKDLMNKLGDHKHKVAVSRRLHLHQPQLSEKIGGSQHSGLW